MHRDDVVRQFLCQLALIAYKINHLHAQIGVFSAQLGLVIAREA